MSSGHADDVPEPSDELRALLTVEVMCAIAALVAEAQIVRGYQVPYVFGASNDSKKVYQSSDVPDVLSDGEHDFYSYSGCTWHECGEWYLMEVLGLTYDDAHSLVTWGVERVIVEDVMGLDFAGYQAAFVPYIIADETEQLLVCPPDLYMGPYLADAKPQLVAAMRAAQAGAEAQGAAKASVAKGAEDQPRDEHGRFSSTGGDGALLHGLSFKSGPSKDLDLSADRRAHTIQIVDEKGNTQYRAEITQESGDLWGVGYVENVSREYSGLAPLLYREMAQYAEQHGGKLIGGMNTNRTSRAVHQTLIASGMATPIQIGDQQLLQIHSTAQKAAVAGGDTVAKVEARDEHGRFAGKSSGEQARALHEAVSAAHEDLSEHLDGLGDASSDLDTAAGDREDAEAELAPDEQYANEADQKDWEGRMSDSETRSYDAVIDARAKLKSLIDRAQAHLDKIDKLHEAMIEAA